MASRAGTAAGPDVRGLAGVGICWGCMTITLAKEISKLAGPR
jgi:hypothetical protein